MRTCIQMGLGFITEYIDLSRDGWIGYTKEHAKYVEEKRQLTPKDGWTYVCGHPWTKIPSNFAENPEPFTYWGIDVSPESIANLADLYKDNERANFICIGTGKRGTFASVETEEHLFLTTNDIDYGHIEKKLNSSRVNFLVMPFHQILKLINPPTFDILAVDIDGHEKGLIYDMQNWHIYPDFLTMELPGEGEGRQDFSPWHDRVKPYGYELIDMVKHTYTDKGNVHECQYARSK